ncbi:hypothetical protein B0H13DRAFT_1895593 [Mycena leptocephala]|nr:hypothetical protein B0H13DRAFT_1895593 [Mycena leptocephala]
MAGGGRLRSRLSIHIRFASVRTPAASTTGPSILPPAESVVTEVPNRRKQWRLRCIFPLDRRLTRRQTTAVVKIRVVRIGRNGEGEVRTLDPTHFYFSEPEKNDTPWEKRDTGSGEVVTRTVIPPEASKKWFYILYLLLTLAARARNAAVSPGITCAFRIENFQGHVLGLSDGSPQPFTPVQSFTPTNTTNQQWALISSQDVRQLWELANVGSDTILSHTTALLPKPGPALHSQIVGSNQTLFWRLASLSEGSRFTDAETGLALTAWPAGGDYPSSPGVEYAGELLGRTRSGFAVIECREGLPEAESDGITEYEQS